MRRTLLVLGALVAAACNEKGVTPPEVAVAGHYTLRTINGFAPPQIIAEDSTGTLSILSGDVFLNSNQSFVDSTDVQFVTDSGTVVESDVGVGIWRLSNDTVFFRTGPTNEYNMLLSGTELRQDFFGIILVYRK